MIKADIALADLSYEPTWHGDRLTIGSSRVTPYAHPMVETLVVRAPGRWFIVVRERLADSLGDIDKHATLVDVPDDTTYHALHQECLLWPLDYTLIEAAQAGHRLRVRAGLLGSAPVYCRVADEQVKVSWDSADFSDRPAMLDMEVASHQLALRTTYAARQLYTGVVLLTERASLHVEPGRHDIAIPNRWRKAAP